MGSFALYLENAAMNYIFGKTAFTPPSTLYVGICTSAADDGTITGEPGAGGYARVAVDNNKTTWTTAATGYLKNAVIIQFPTATGDWGTMSMFFISDDPSAGNIFATGALAASKNILNGDIARFNANSLEAALE